MIATSRRPSFRPALSPAARAVATAAALSAALALAGCGEAPKAAVADKPAALQFGPNDLTAIRTQPMARTLPISGSLIAVNQAVVRSKVAVEVRAINVREGDRVVEGQVIAKLDTVDLTARLDQAAGQRNAAHAQFDIAEKNRTTNASLLEKHFISQNAFDNVASLSSANRATLDAADAAVRMSQKALRDATVVAPISGIVSRKNAQVGEKTSIDAPLFQIVDLDSIELQAIVPAGDVAEVNKGMHATLAVDGMTGRTFDAIVSRVNPATEPGTRSIIVFFTVPNPEHVLKSGMYANGSVRLAASTPRQTLPTSAVQSEAGIPIVWTIENDKLVRRTVELGARDDATGLVEIRSGLPPNVPVVASRFENLKEGGPAVALLGQPSAQAAR